jgi:hypothetical protein
MYRFNFYSAYLLKCGKFQTRMNISKSNLAKSRNGLLYLFAC